LGLLVGSGVLFSFFLKAAETVWQLTGLPRFEEWPVTVDILTAFVVSAGIGFWSRRWEKVNRFLNEAVMELIKVSWPPRKETVASSGVVALLVGIAAILLALIDGLWGTMARRLFR